VKPRIARENLMDPSTVDLAETRDETDAWLDELRQWDAAWAEQYLRVSRNPWHSGHLPRKTVELICVALHAACTNLQASGTRQHIRAALEAGATREEILTVLKMAALLAIHSCSLGAPLLVAEAKAAGLAPEQTDHQGATPASDAVRAMGQWNVAWDPFFALDPTWTDQFMAVGIGIYSGEVLSAKDAELLSIALDASVTHMYAPGTQRHIKAALAAGATVAEIMDVLKLCVAFGSASLQLGVPILAEELARRGRG
jgi:alkylhydroperoxidase/carboxymuconolactone decarboxylase family protein YurZ